LSAQNDVFVTLVKNQKNGLVTKTVVAKADQSYYGLNPLKGIQNSSESVNKNLIACLSLS